MSGSRLSNENEAVLLQMLTQGSEPAFREIMERFWKRLFVVAMNRLENIHDAEECVQDVFSDLWIKRRQISIKYTLNTYLTVAVRYKAIDTLDARYRRQNRVANLPVSESSPSAEESLMERELALKIKQSVSNLPEMCRIVFIMSRDDQKSVREIADTLGVSERNVRKHIDRALRDIRRDLAISVPVVLISSLLDGI